MRYNIEMNRHFVNKIQSDAKILPINIHYFSLMSRYVICDVEASPLMSKSLLEKIRNNKNTVRASLVKL